MPRSLRGDYRHGRDVVRRLFCFTPPGTTPWTLLRSWRSTFTTVYADLHAFEREGLASVRQSRCLGAPPRLTTEQWEEIVRLAEVPLYELGLPYSRWSLAKLREYLIQYQVLKRISREHLRRVLE
ncbi:helix-turn-helix domain-containing protein [Singulisphaera sp. Ch08]|uniref:Helix-turn-helix domain-containing protein n=1 Tax=Singulisphaera sp. Ch08 TaxID=3120278 RepID=A0AAU7CMB1_9BACT